MREPTYCAVIAKAVNKDQLFLFTDLGHDNIAAIGVADENFEVFQPVHQVIQKIRQTFPFVVLCEQSAKGRPNAAVVDRSDFFHLQSRTMVGVTKADDARNGKVRVCCRTTQVQIKVAFQLAALTAIPHPYKVPDGPSFRTGRRHLGPTFHKNLERALRVLWVVQKASFVACTQRARVLDQDMGQLAVRFVIEHFKFLWWRDR